METSKTSRVGLWLAFQLCKAIDENGRLPVNDCGVNAELPEDFAPAPGSFALLVQDDNEHLCFSEDIGARDLDTVIFEPWKGRLESGEAYLYGTYDPFHRWLGYACVQRFVRVVGEKAIFTDDKGRPSLEDAINIAEYVIVGRLVAIVPSRARSRAREESRRGSSSSRPLSRGRRLRVVPKASSLIAA
jgi:hypothetical protein